MPHLPKNLSTLLLALSLAAAATSCGAVQEIFGKKSRSGSSDANPYPTAPAAPATTPVPVAPKGAAPLITRLTEGTVLPAHLKATSLLITFSANDPTATFDCQVGNQSIWAPCNAGAGYDFGRLAHSKNYSVKIRARGTDGRVDANPILVAFAADMLGGVAPTLPGSQQSLAANVIVPSTVADLPLLVKSTSSTTLSASRVLLVGAYYSLTVPGNSLVTGFGSDKTYSAATHTMLLMPNGGAIIGNNGICSASYQRLVTAADGSQYCDATPSTADQTAAGTAALPRNFVEVSINPSSGLREALLTAAVDGTAFGDPDAAVNRLTITSRCVGSASAGQSPIPLLNQFYASGPQSQTLVWCRTRTVSGRSQWLGMVNAQLTADPTGPALRVIYAVDAGQALITSTQFIQRLTQVMLQQLTPIAPLAPSA